MTYDQAVAAFAGTWRSAYINGYYNGPRTNGYDDRDINFANNYKNSPWESQDN